MDLCVLRYGVATQTGGEWFVNDKLGGFIDKLAPRFNNITLLLSYPRKEDKTFYPNGRSLYSYKIKASNVRLVTQPLVDPKSRPMKKAVNLLRNLRRYVREIEKADFVYITMPGFSFFVASMICALMRKPYCLYFGADWQEIAPYMGDWRGFSKFLYHLYVGLSRLSERVAVKRSEFTVVHGKRLLEKFAGLDAKIVETIPMISIQKRDIFCRDDTCAGGHIRCLYVGSLIPRKGIIDLIKGVGLIRKRGRDVSLELVGPADEKYRLAVRREAERLGIEGVIRFAGYITEIRPLLKHYRRADIFVLPSRGEGFPRVIYEAMSQGLPVVATEIGTIKAELISGKEAILVPPRSPEELAEAIEEVIKNADLRRELIRNGYVFVSNKIGERSAVEQFIELINKTQSVRD